MSSEVFENVRIRSAEISQGRSTGRKTALIVPGGVRRAICNCGALAALNSLGINYFDSVYAVSAGAINAAYGLANQAALGVTIYLEEVSEHRFLNPLRFWNIIDMDYLFREIIHGRKALDTSALQANPSQLRVLAADITHGQANWLVPNAGNLTEVLKAACATEIPSSRPVSIQGVQYRDGYLLEPLPLLSALKENYTDILVLLNRPKALMDTPVAQWLQKGLINRWNRKAFGPALVERCENGWREYNRALEIVGTGSYERPGGEVIQIGAIAPDIEISMFESNTRRLFQAACSSWQETFRAFGAQETGRSSFLKALSEAGLKPRTLRKLSE